MPSGLLPGKPGSEGLLDGGAGFLPAPLPTIIVSLKTCGGGGAAARALPSARRRAGRVRARPPRAPGDANLDGLSDVLDAAAILAGGRYESGLPASWATGDFTYDGIVDILDASQAISAGLFDAGPYQPAARVAVPEQAAAWVAVVGAAVFRYRRRAEVV